MALKHEALIRAALDGAVIQRQIPRQPAGATIGSGWVSFNNSRAAISHMIAEWDAYEYRTAPPPDKVVYRLSWKKGDHRYWNDYEFIPNLIWQTGEAFDSLFKITYEGGSSKVKSVEVIQ